MLPVKEPVTDDTTGGAATYRLAVLGAGVMGVGIATLASGRGFPVVLIDLDEMKLATASARIAYQARAARLLGALPEPRAASGPVTCPVTSTSLAAAADSAALIEAVPEAPEIKAKALAEAETVLRQGTPLISNTSSIPVGELARSLVHPEALIGAHFMNPPYLIGQIEVARGPLTSDATLRAALALLAALGLQPVMVGDGPGFVTSRLLHPMINDAARIVGEGIATAAEVDTLLQGCLGHRTGPLRTADLIGLDNLVDSLWVLYQRTGNEACRPCGVLLEKVRQGELGRKTGKGFYEYGEALA